jgi:hypothetical protein
MAATQRPSGKDMPPEPAIDGQPPPVPDEDGPHDVSDDTVIEKTLPTARTSGDEDKGGPSRGKP